MKRLRQLEEENDKLKKIVAARCHARLTTAGEANRQCLHRVVEWQVPRRVVERTVVHEPRRRAAKMRTLETTTRCGRTRASATPNEFAARGIWGLRASARRTGPAGDRCSQQGKPSQVSNGPKKQGRSEVSDGGTISPFSSQEQSLPPVQPHSRHYVLSPSRQWVEYLNHKTPVTETLWIVRTINPDVIALPEQTFAFARVTD